MGKKVPVQKSTKKSIGKRRKEFYTASFPYYG